MLYNFYKVNTKFSFVIINISRYRYNYEHVKKFMKYIFTIRKYSHIVSVNTVKGKNS